MEQNNSQLTQQAPVGQQASSPTAVPTATGQVLPQATVITDQKIGSGGSNSNKMMIIAIVVILLLVAGGGYWYMTKSSTTLNTSSQVSTTSTQSVLGALKTELDSVDVDEASAQEDLTQLDKDLSEL